MPVYAVTVMYEDIEQVSRLVRHLFDQTVKVKAVIVVDNSEKQHISKSELSSLSEDGTIYYYKLSSNIGSSGGFAVGQAVALQTHNSIEPCWIWLNDQDGYPERDCLETMIEDFKDYPTARIICPIVYDMKNKYREKSIARRRLTAIGTTKRYYSSSGSKSINLAGSAGIIIHSSLIEEIGFYDHHHFFTNLEDYEYTLRAYRHSKKTILLSSNAKYFHPIAKNKFSYLPLFRWLPLYLGQYKDGDLKRNQEYVFSASFIMGKHLSFLQKMTTILYSVIRLVLSKFYIRNISVSKTLGMYIAGCREGEKYSREFSFNHKEAVSELVKNIKTSIVLDKDGQRLFNKS